MSSDGTSYNVELYVGADEWNVDGWEITRSHIDTFDDAVDHAKLLTGQYRKVRILRVVKTVVAEYQDGVANG